LLAFVRGAASSAGLVAGVRRILAQLAAATGETAVYAMPTDGRTDASLTIVPLDQVESEHSLRYVSKLGTPVLATETAAGHVFLAFRNPATRRSDAKRSPVISAA
jgi:DNA-binding IclR family transcriptional regulator